MKKKTIIITIVIGVIICILGASAITFSTLWQNAENSLEAANQAVLDEANYNRSLKNKIDQLQQELKEELKAEEENYMKLGRTLEETQEELAEAREKLAQNTIIGHAYMDRFRIGALEDGDLAATGFKVRLYEVVGKENILVAETTVNDRGEYRFIIEPGEYYVEPVLAIPGYPQWEQVIWLKNPGNGKVSGGETIIGPIFLIRQYGGMG